MSKKKGQAAVEFLMTYGWMLFLLAFALAVLYYMNLLDVSTYITRNQCIMPHGLDCIDYKLYTNHKMDLIVANGLSYAITLNNVSGDCYNDSLNINLQPANGTTLILTCPNAPTGVGQSYSAAITVNYTIDRTGNSHVLSGKIMTKTEE